MSDAVPCGLLLDGDDLDGFFGRFDGQPRIAWAIEEVVDVGPDGSAQLVERFPGEGWTISLGWGDVVTELDVAFAPEPNDNGRSADHIVAMPSVRTASLDRVRSSLAELIGASLSDIVLIHDPDWQHHRHPLADVLATRT